jgi:hypothetical protein
MSRNGNSAPHRPQLRLHCSLALKHALHLAVKQKTLSGTGTPHSAIPVVVMSGNHPEFPDSSILGFVFHRISTGHHNTPRRCNVDIPHCDRLALRAWSHSNRHTDRHIRRLPSPGLCSSRHGTQLRAVKLKPIPLISPPPRRALPDRRVAVTRRRPYTEREHAPTRVYSDQHPA